MNANDLGPLPKVNPRRAHLEDAALEIGKTLHDLFQKYDLTVSERFYVLTTEMAGLTRACIATEHKKYRKD